MKTEKIENILCLDTAILAAQVFPALAIGTAYAVGLLIADKSWELIRKKGRKKR